MPSVSSFCCARILSNIPGADPAHWVCICSLQAIISITLAAEIPTMCRLGRRGALRRHLVITGGYASVSLEHFRCKNAAIYCTCVGGFPQKFYLGLPTYGIFMCGVCMQRLRYRPTREALGILCGVNGIEKQPQTFIRKYGNYCAIQAGHLQIIHRKFPHFII